MSEVPIKVTFLGTGTSSGVPLLLCDCEACCSSDFRDKRLRCSVYVEIGDTKILIDTGTDFRQQMLRENIKKIDYVLFTHGHKDHTGGLDDIRAFNFKTNKEITVFADAICEKMIRNQYDYVFAEKRYPGIPQIFIEPIGLQKFKAGDIDIIPIQVMHHKLPVTCFRIGDFTYITDAKTISEKEKEKVKGTKVLVVNALREKEHLSHFNLEEALKFVNEIKPEKTYFIHISHNFGKHTEILKKLPKNITVAYDGLKITI